MTSQPTSNETIMLNASCHCRGFSASYTLPKSVFPLKAAVCSCTSCRHVTGQLNASFAVMPSGSALPSGDTLRRYKFSENLTVTFCGVCGATVYNEEPTEWECASGILSVRHEGTVGDERREGKGKGIEGLLNRQMLFVGDTGDGGVAVWMPEKDSAGIEMKRHIGHRTSPEVDVDKMAREFAGREKKANERLHGNCHCGAVSFFITRPTPGEPRADKDKGKWWLADQKDERCQKWGAKLDACDSCRLTIGFEVLAWLFVPKGNAFLVDGSLFNVNDKALTQYTSSEGCWRTFCNTCGAFICFWNVNRDVQVLDFGVGLFNGQGARLEDWVEWEGLEFVEDALDRKFVEGIVAKVGRAEH